MQGDAALAPRAARRGPLTQCVAAGGPVACPPTWPARTEHLLSMPLCTRVFGYPLWATPCRGTATWHVGVAQVMPIFYSSWVNVELTMHECMKARTPNYVLHSEHD